MTITLQLAPRSEQLNGIAETFKTHLNLSDKERQKKMADKKYSRQLLGYCEQLGIISDELKAQGK